MFGLILSVIADIISPFGVALQKIGHQRNERFWRSGVWWLGLGLMIGAEIGNGVAYGDEQIATSAITAVGCIGILANAIISRVLLKEVFTRYNLLGAAIVVIGVLQVIGFAPRSEEPIDVWDERGISARPISIAVISTLAGFVVVSTSFAFYKNPRRTGQSILWILPSSIFGGLGVIAARYAFMLVIDAAQTKQLHMFNDTVFYISWVGIVVCGIGQLFAFNKALAIDDTRIVVPVFYVLFTLIASTASSIVYNEFTKGSLVEWILFIDSFVLCIGGIMLLLHRTPTENRSIEVTSDQESVPQRNEVSLNPDIVQIETINELRT